MVFSETISNTKTQPSQKKINILNKELGENFTRVFFKKNKQRIFQILDGKTPPPKEVEIQPSSVCNAGCLHCFGRDFKKTRNILYKKENMENIVKQVLDMDTEELQVEKVKFCGSTGEPLMNPYTLDAIEMLHDKKNLELFTNGIKLAENLHNKHYLRTLSKLPEMNLSLDAGTTETLHLTKPGSKHIILEDILESSKKIKEMSEKGIFITSSFVITSNNYDEIVIAAKNAEYCSSQINFRIDMTDREVSRKHKDKIIDDLEEAKKLQTDKFKVYAAHKKKDVEREDQKFFSTRDLGLKCYLSHFWTCIGSDANLYPCGHIVAKGTPNCGSLMQKPLKEIWGSRERKEYQNKVPLPQCDICSPFSLVTNKLMNIIAECSKKELQEVSSYYIN